MNGGKPPPSGRRSNLVVALGRARVARSAAWTARLFLGGLVALRLVAANRRRKNVEWDGLTTVATVWLGLHCLAITAIVTVIAPRPIARAETLAAVLALLGRGVGFGLGQLFVALILVELIVALAARSLLFEAGAALAQDTEIMVRELEEIFGLNAIAGELGVARHALIFLKELRGIPALAIVLAVPRLSTKVPAAAASLSPAAAPATALSVVDQMPTSLTPWN
jgi:hypothetical protein